jgi:anti-sigma B factor antagonist
MPVDISRSEDIAVAAVSGDIDGKSAPGLQEELLPQFQNGAKVLLDLSGTAYMSSAGLRMLLMLDRKAKESQSKLVLAGLSADIRKVMSATGFLKFFAVAEDREAGLAVLRS